MSRLFPHNNNNNYYLKQSKIVSIFPLKIAEKKSVLKFRVYNPNTRMGIHKNFIRESARGNRLTSPSREYQNDVVFIALLDFNPILESFDVLFDVQRDE